MISFFFGRSVSMINSSSKLVCLTVLASALAALAGGASPSLANPPDAGARVIVRFAADANGVDKHSTVNARVRALTAAPDVVVSDGPAPGTALVSAHDTDAESLARELAAAEGIEYAVVDRRKQIRAIPNDPLYAQQWLLQRLEPAAIDVEPAWAVTTGTADVVVAVIDTGIRPEHEDLRDRLLPGYDFITDVLTAGDGDGRDPDPTDPGDYLTSADLASSFFFGCGSGSGGLLPTRSSWHGTRVSGVIAATGNNSRGIAGVSWSASLLPVRALGKCGGFDSDVIAAMRWAGGLEVPGVPANPHPARVINLSLGGPGECSPAYLQTVAELRDQGVFIVASAGNNLGLVEEPGNCPGVFTVAGLRHAGTKVGYSSFGPSVDIAAPAGNCVNVESGEPCTFQIPTTTNLGATDPGADGYSDGSNPTYGTSFAAPLASGVAALMLSLHPGLNPDALSMRMRAAARPFAVEPGLAFCPEVDATSGQCNCTIGWCGDGMLDAGGAVAAALAPAASFESVAQNGALRLDAGSSSTSLGRQLVAWQWSQAEGPAAVAFSNPQEAVTQLQAPVSGTYRVSLTVTDSAGGQDTRVLALELDPANVAEPEPDPSSPAPEPEPDPEGTKRSRGGGGLFDVPAVAGLLLLVLAAGYTGGRRRRTHETAAMTLPPR